MIPQFEETIELGPTFTPRVPDVNILWPEILNKCNKLTFSKSSILPDVWEEGNGAAVDEEERSLHGLTLNERFGFLEDHSQAASIGQITIADSIFLNELKLENSKQVKVSLACRVYNDEMNRCSCMLAGVIDRASSLKTMKTNSKRKVDIFHHRVDYGNIEMRNNRTGSSIEGNSAENTEGGDQIHGGRAILQNEEVSSFDGEDSSLKEAAAEVGKQQQQQESLLNSDEEDSDLVVSADDDGGYSEVETTRMSNLLLVALKKDLISLHCGIQRAVSFKMQTAASLCEEVEMVYARVAWDCIVDNSNNVHDNIIWNDAATLVFRGTGTLILLVWLFGLNMCMWNRFGIDYKRCLDLQQHERTRWRSRYYGGGGRSHRHTSSRKNRWGEGLLMGSLTYVDDPTDQSDPVQDAWSLSCELSIVWLSCFLVFYKLLHAFPVLLLIYAIHRYDAHVAQVARWWLLFPWFQKGRPLLIAVFRAIAAPFIPTCFLDSYVGDYLTSTVRILVDLGFSFLYVMAGTRGWLSESTRSYAEVGGATFYFAWISPAIAVAPLWWRFFNTLRSVYDDGQRLPNLGNSLKYASAIIISAHGSLQPGLRRGWMWILAFIVVTLYQLFWDIFMDWNAFRFERPSSSSYYSNGRSREKNLLPRVSLRPERAFPRWFYYLAIFLDTILRFLWTASIIPEYQGGMMFGNSFERHLSLYVSIGELARRSMWGIIRVENEHVRMCRIDSSSPPQATPDDDGGLLPDGPFIKMDTSSSFVSSDGRQVMAEGGCTTSQGNDMTEKNLILELSGYFALLFIIVIVVAKK